MRVFFIMNDSFPNGMASVSRVKCYAKALMTAGAECEVIATRRLEQNRTNPKNAVPKGVYEGIPFRYIGGTTFRRKNHFLRVMNDYIDKVHTLVYLLCHLHKGDVVYGYASDQISFINNVIRVAHIKGAKFFKELCELPFGTGEETPKRIEQRHDMEKTQFPICDGIIPISDALEAYSRQFTNDTCKYLKVPILVDFDRYNLEDKSAESEIPYIFHSGTLYEQKDGFLGMIEAFGKACQKIDRPVRFISTGKKEKSPHVAEIDALIKKYNLQDKVIFTGYLSDDELKDHLQKASMVIINKAPNQQNTYCFSTKLGEYMAAGKAIIITRVGEAMNWLTDGKDALIIPPLENDTLADAIVRLFSDDELRKALGENARETCRKSFDYRDWARR